MVEWQWMGFEELGAAGVYAVLQLRQAVFVVEQTCPYLDADGLDDRALHLLGWREGELVAYLRAFAPGVQSPDAIVIGRVITESRARGEGLGLILMREGARRAFGEWGHHDIHLSAQAHLEGWYGKLGYRVVGPGYDEDGIPHLPMRFTP